MNHDNYRFLFLSSHEKTKTTQNPVHVECIIVASPIWTRLSSFEEFHHTAAQYNRILREHSLLAIPKDNQRLLHLLSIFKRRSSIKYAIIVIVIII